MHRRVPGIQLARVSWSRDVDPAVRLAASFLRARRSHGSRARRRWACDGVALAAIAREVGTPCYVYSAALIRARYRALTAALSGCRHSVHYALKANSTLGLVRLIQGLGASADCNSVGEIEVALKAGFLPHQIVFTGVGKSAAEIARAVALGLKAINAESRGELERIDADRRARPAHAAWRCASTPTSTPRAIRTSPPGSTRNKFGVPIGDARGAARRDGRAAGAAGGRRPRPRRLADHHARAAARAAERWSRSSPSCGATASPLEHLDLGGGLGISYDGGAVPDVYGLRAALVDAARPTGLSLIVEPGRWLVGPPARSRRVIDMKPRDAGGGRSLVARRRDDRPDAAGALRRVHRIVRVEPASGRPCRATSSARSARAATPSRRPQPRRPARRRPSWRSSTPARTARRWARTTTAGRWRRRCSSTTAAGG